MSRFTGEQRGVILAAGVVVGILIIGFALSATLLRDRDNTNLGDERFQDLRAAQILQSVDQGGPVFFADLTDGQRDIYVTHVGDDDLSGFLAFLARHPDTGCLVQWQPDDNRFEDLCDPENIIDPAGGGLTHFPVELVDGRLVIDINAADREPETDSDQ